VGPSDVGGKALLNFRKRLPHLPESPSFCTATIETTIARRRHSGGTGRA
jgi:hypothetical protein